MCEIKILFFYVEAFCTKVTYEVYSLYYNRIEYKTATTNKLL